MVDKLEKSKVEVSTVSLEMTTQNHDDVDDSKSLLLTSLDEQIISNFVPKPLKRKRLNVKAVDSNVFTTEDFNKYISSGIKLERLPKSKK